MSEEKNKAVDSEEKGLLFGVPNLLRQKFLAAFSIPQELERKVEEGINRALVLLNIPSREEVRNLQNRLDQLIDRCEAINGSKTQSGKFSELKETKRS